MTLLVREVLHEVHQAATGLEELLVRGLLSLVDQVDLDAFVQERELAQPFGEGLALELAGLGEDLGVGPELHRRAGLRGGLALDELGGGLPRA